jgi:TonB family protein
MLNATHVRFNLPAVVFTCCLAAVAFLPATASASDAVRVVPGSDLGTWWVQDKKVTPRYPIKALHNGDMGCVAIAYTIEEDGTTSAHRAIAEQPAGVFDRAAIEAIEQWRFEPANGNPGRQPVQSYVTLLFDFSRGNKPVEHDREAIFDRCETAAATALAGMQAVTGSE